MDSGPEPRPRPPGPWLRRLLVGKPRDLTDRRLFHRLSLVAFLAWVGLGADGLSSSAYGPEEAFRQLGEHRYLAVALALLMAVTVLLISTAYRRIIEKFPTGGGGYVVASKLLGKRAGLLSGSALLVDYVLTITISIAAAGDALFSFLPATWAGAKFPCEVAFLLGMVVLNLRGVRESVLTLVPVFLLFLLTHAVIILAALIGQLAQIGSTAHTISDGFRSGATTIGVGGMAIVFLRAYSLGAGTYTGIEAVSNGLPIMREPRVETGKRTMLYMGISLALTASGLLLAYLLWDLQPAPGKTMNAVLVERVAGGIPFGSVLVVATLLSEALLLVVAAQAGFIDGPRVLSNMAVDSWVPHRFAALSERLTTQNGILLMGAAALVALFYTGGAVSHLVVMYAINVFVTFSLSMAAMLRYWQQHRRRPRAVSNLALFTVTLLLCLGILGVTLYEKLLEGGWVTVTVTCLVIILCLLIHRHYRAAADRVNELYHALGSLADPLCARTPEPPDPRLPIAAVLVEDFGGVGIHTVLNVFRTFPNHFKGILFLSVGVIDSGEFKGEHAMDHLRLKTEEMLGRYLQLAADLKLPATARMRLGTEVVSTAETLCLEAAREFPGATFFAGKLIFPRPRWWHRLLHNETAAAIQERLQWAGRTLVTLPIRVREAGTGVA